MPLRYSRSCFLSVATLGFFVPLSAHAGMTMPVLTDVVQARLQVISFFLFGYLLLAFVYRLVWNSMAKDFPKMPRISYRGALCALVVCGLFIYVVLTMISGARELMTPGAWARTGIGYKIRDPEKDPKPWLDTARKASLIRLRAALWHYAEQHANTFPASREDKGIPVEAWRTIDPDGLLFDYMPGLKPDAGSEVLAYEPGSFGADRFVLLSDGEIVEMKVGEITARVQKRIDAMEASLKAQ